jgi:hypothetical protein
MCSHFCLNLGSSFPQKASGTGKAVSLPGPASSSPSSGA